MFNKRWALIAVLVAAMLILAACGSGAVQTVVVTEVVEVAGEEVVVTQIVEVPPDEVEAPPKDTIIICMSQEPDSLYGITTTMAVSIQIFHASHSGGWYYDRGFFYESRALVDDDGDGMGDFPSFENGDAVIEGEGADSVLSVTYRFRDDITYSDGEPWSVDDILYTREVLLDPDSGATTRGIQDQMTFEKVDDYTLKVSYPPGVKDPTYFLPPYMGANSFQDALPEHVLGDMTPAEIAESEYARLPNPVLGPYEYVEWVEGDHVTLKAVDGWWGGDIVTPNLVYRFITDTNQLLASVLSGECDYATSDGLQATQLPFIQQSADQGLIKYEAIPSLVWEHIEFNSFPPEGAESGAVPFFADTRVRQAVAYGTNRLEMTEQILYGEVEPLDSHLPADHWGFNPDIQGSYQYDPDQANALLDEAGWVAGDDGMRTAGAAISGDFSCGRGSYTIPAGTKFEVSFHTTTGNAMREQLSAILQSNMADIGIQVNLDLLPASVWFADDGPLFTRTYQLGEFAWVTGPNPNPSGLYSGMNVFRTPDGEFLVASTILENDPSVVDGLTPAAGFPGDATDWFKFGRPTDDDLPEGYAVGYYEQIPDSWDEYEGQNDLGWCDEEATQAAFDADNLIEPSERVPFLYRFQEIFRDEVPTLPLFQRLEVEAHAVDLCNTQGGPATYSSWNVETWYFGDCGE